MIFSVVVITFDLLVSFGLAEAFGLVAFGLAEAYR